MVGEKGVWVSEGVKDKKESRDFAKKERVEFSDCAGVV